MEDAETRQSVFHKYRFQVIALVITLSLSIVGAIIRAQSQIEIGLVLFIGASLLTATIFLSTLTIKEREDVGDIVRKNINRIESDFRGQVEEISGNLRKMRDNPEVKDFYDKTIDALCKAFEIKDSVFRELASSELDEFRLHLVSGLSLGVVSFRAESWRLPYQKILGQKDVDLYRSIAWVKSDDYWADEAGKLSVEFNYDLIAKGKRIERIFILRENVWTSVGLKKWIREQKNKGINVKIARESSIPPEEDLLHDLGIYGNRAVGYQNTDDRCRTIRFDLHFDKTQIEKAIGIFERLKMHTLKPSEVEAYLGSGAPRTK